MSKQRDLIERIIKESMLHLTAEEIYKEARKEMPNISLGTVYRNLGNLVDEGKVRKLKTTLGYDIYDKSIYPHGHILCLKCRRVYDYNSDEITQILKRDFKYLDSYELMINTICDDCQKNTKNKGDN